jgi:nucleoside diphosphate kinase
MSTDDMGQYEKVLGLKNLGKLSVLYEQNHHLLQLLETDLLVREEIEEDYSSAERKAFKKGLFSILVALANCYQETEDKKVVKDEE